jgi:hypothetical protein
MMAMRPEKRMPPWIVKSDPVLKRKNTKARINNPNASPSGQTGQIMEFPPVSNDEF